MMTLLIFPNVIVASTSAAIATRPLMAGLESHFPISGTGALPLTLAGDADVPLDTTRTDALSAPASSLPLSLIASLNRAQMR
jgi:hypothetical protein